LISPAEFLSEKGYKHVRPVAAYCEKYEPILDQIHKGDADLPIVLRGFSKDWPACHKWEEQYFLARWGDVQVTPSIALPTHGVPYLISDAEVRQKMSLTEYWQELTKKGRCYIDQHPLSIFPGLADDCHITELMGRKEYILLNLWLGREAKSGLHLDYADNFNHGSGQKASRPCSSRGNKPTIPVYWRDNKESTRRRESGLHTFSQGNWCWLRGDRALCRRRVVHTYGLVALLVLAIQRLFYLSQLLVERATRAVGLVSFEAHIQVGTRYTPCEVIMKKTQLKALATKIHGLAVKSASGKKPVQNKALEKLATLLNQTIEAEKTSVRQHCFPSPWIGGEARAQVPAESSRKKEGEP
jgi:hypothetical protein